MGMYPKILGVGLGVPQHEYTQMEIYERFLKPHLGTNRRARAIFGRAGIKRRFTAVEGNYHEINRGTEAARAAVGIVNVMSKLRSK